MNNTETARLMAYHNAKRFAPRMARKIISRRSAKNAKNAKGQLGLKSRGKVREQVGMETLFFNRK